MAETLRLRVPESARRILSTVARLSADGRTAITAPFTATADLPQSAEALEEQLQAVLSADDAKDFVRQVFSLSGLLTSGSYDADTVAAAAAEAENLDLEVAERAQLTGLLRTALDSPVARVLGKGSFLFQEQDKVFTGARIVSDLRPVLDDDGKDPTAAMIMHRLRLSFFTKGSEEAIEIGLTPDALDSLQRVVERARDKEEAYHGLLQRADLRLIDPTL